MSISKHMKREHLKVVRTLGYALVLDNWDGWSAFMVIAEARLTERERAALAYSSLRTLRPDQAGLVAETNLLRDAPKSFLDTPSGCAALTEWRDARDKRRRRAA